MQATTTPPLERGHNRYFFAIDLLLIVVAAYLSFALRLDSLVLQEYWSTFLVLAGASLFIIPGIFFWMRIYSRYWHYASTDELLLLIGSIGMATLLVTAFVMIVGLVSTAVTMLPRSIPFLFFLLAVTVTASPRLLWRIYAQHKEEQWGTASPMIRLREHKTSRKEPLRVLIVGAERAGAMVAREIQQNTRLKLELVGFVDDDPGKLHLHIHGAKVLGTCADIPVLVERHDLKQVIIAIPGAPGRVIRTIKHICEESGVQAKVVPGMETLLDTNAQFSQIRDIQIEDLLRRDSVRIDAAALGTLLQGKRVLVTGGGGSIGSELCRQILRFHPAELIILGHGENSIFEIHNELQQTVAQYAAHSEQDADAPPPPKLSPVIADIRLRRRIQAVFNEYRPDIVFHAAAHKHVPLMENNPAEAITNNLLGSHNLLEAAMSVDVERFVMISTDKAVNPTSLMGASKRTAELLVHQAALKTGRPYMAVRFGNVLGSRGSVVLTFKKQIAAGGPVTVTHPDMTRYFMTIPEAVQLVLHAGVLGQGGEVFTLDMGEPVRIADLARDMIELSGLEVGHDIDIVYTGMRPGEKLYEELFIDGEEFQRTAHEKIFIAANASTYVPLHLNEWIEALILAGVRNDVEAIILVLQRLIPQNQLKQAFSLDDGQPLALELLAEELSMGAIEDEAAMFAVQDAATLQPAAQRVKDSTFVH